jgi:C1A family cysteine protease
LSDINLHNTNASETFKLGINKFSDHTYEEFVSKYTGFSAPKSACVVSYKRIGTMLTTKPTTTTKTTTTTKSSTTTKSTTTTKSPTTTKPTTTTTSTTAKSNSISLPISVDWRNSPLVGPIKDQGLCGLATYN